MPETNGQLSPLGQMILDELKEQRRDLGEVREDVREAKTDLRHLREGQTDMAKRLQKLETLAAKSLPLDPKTILKVCALLGTVALAASQGVPEGVWKALIGMLGGS